MELFWKMFDHLQNQFPGFGPSGRYKGLPRRFKKAVYSIDSSTITQVANYLNMQTFLPSFPVIEEGSHHDNSRMIALCARLAAGRSLFSTRPMSTLSMFFR